MSNRVDFGMSSWDEETGGGARKQQQGERSKVEFMRLKDGPNLVRIVTKPFKYLVHKYKEEGEPGFGDRASCSKPTHPDCPLCLRGDKPKKRWYIGVIDRATGEYKVLDIGSGIYGSIRDLNRDEAWGDPVNYDVVIKVNRKGDPKDYYTVLPRPSQPLSPADLEHKSAKNEEDLARRCTPPQPEWVLSRINALREKKGLSALGALSANATKAPASTAAAEVDNSDDGEDTMFPAADE